MTLTAWVFPGQGSQFVGMGRDLYENFPEARATFDQADDALGVELSRLCFEGPEVELTDTLNAQPAILTHSIAALNALKSTLGARCESPLFAAGHSLGEFSALVAAGALEFRDAIKLVRARGAAMKRAGELRPGAMAAVLGLEDQKLIAICAQAKHVQVANFNAPGQIVISGEKNALERALALAKQAGAKRTITLAVSIAAHSELMRPAAEEFFSTVMNTPMQSPQIPVVSNVTAEPLEDVEAIRAEMIVQLTSSLQWVQSIDYMVTSGVRQFLEIGPKDVLAGLIRRITKDASVTSVGDRGTINARLEGVPA